MVYTRIWKYKMIIFSTAINSQSNKPKTIFLLYFVFYYVYNNFINEINYFQIILKPSGVCNLWN